MSGLTQYSKHKIFVLVPKKLVSWNHSYNKYALAPSSCEQAFKERTLLEKVTGDKLFASYLAANLISITLFFFNKWLGCNMVFHCLNVHFEVPPSSSKSRRKLTISFLEGLEPLFRICSGTKISGEPSISSYRLTLPF